MPDETNETGDVAQDAQTDATDAAASQDGETAANDLAQLKGALDKERESHKAAKAEVKSLKAEVSKLSDAGKSEIEQVTAERDRLHGRLADLEKQIQETTGREAVRQSAKGAGAPDVDIVYRVVRGDLEFNDEGMPVNVAALIASLKQESPALFRPSGTADAGAGIGTAPKEADWLKTALRRKVG